MKKYALEIVVFICGAATMVFELAGSRILAPYLGTSLIVWTSLIGIILGSLSVGCWQGGRIADKNPNFAGLSLLVLFSGMAIGMTAVSNAFILETMTKYFSGAYLKVIFSCVLLFALPSVFLGMILPYAIRLKIKDISKSGQTAGNLSALSTAGSIAGTFLAGFYLIPFFGISKILLILSVFLMSASLLACFQRLKINLFSIAILVPIFTFCSCKSESKKNYIDTDTQYNRVIIKEKFDRNLLRPTLNLITDPCGIQSIMYADEDDDLAAEYSKYYRLAGFFTNIKKSLMIGGGGFSYPKDYLKQYPLAQIDVIEIDSKMIELAKKHFNLKPSPRMNIFNEDGRVFLNKSQEIYDAIFIDAFASNLAMPYQLATKEAIEKMRQCLSDNGVVILNLVSAIKGEKSKFLQAEYATYKSIFDQVYLFPVYSKDIKEKTQNIILVAIKSNHKIDFEAGNRNPVLNEYFSHLLDEDIDFQNAAILSDDYAPVDYYTMGLCS